MTVDELMRLRREAAASARTRGHRLGLWHTWESVADSRGWSFCRNDGCVAKVDVDVHPPANGIDIAGTAVALNCPVADGA